MTVSVHEGGALRWQAAAQGLDEGGGRCAGGPDRTGCRRGA
jgi:hypothetical protein